MCKALAGSGRLSVQTFCRTKLDLQHRWVNWRGSWAHPVVLRWVARAFRRRGDVHDGVVRRRGRRSGARVSGRWLMLSPRHSRRRQEGPMDYLLNVRVLGPIQGQTRQQQPRELLRLPIPRL
eukprot:scaffold16270_cov135-Isochrysis_galbana.AAC.1